MRGAERAAEVRAILGKRPSSSEIVAARFGVPVYAMPLKGRLRALYMDGAIAVRLGLPHAERQHLILHELAHHLMHADVAVARASLDHRGCTLSRIEAEAEEFAYFFTLTDAELDRLVLQGWQCDEIAAQYLRTPAWVRARALLPVALAEGRAFFAPLAALVIAGLAAHHCKLHWLSVAANLLGRHRGLA